MAQIVFLDGADHKLIFGFEKIIRYASPISLGPKKQKGGEERAGRKKRPKGSNTASKSDALSSRLKNKNGKKKPRK